MTQEPPSRPPASGAAVDHEAEGTSSKPPRTPTCPLCDESHDEILALLARDNAIHRIPSDDLLAEEEYQCRELASEIMARSEDVDLRAYRHHRLQVLRGELARRRRLEEFGAPHVGNAQGIPQEVLERIKRGALIEVTAFELGLLENQGSRPKLAIHCPLPNHQDAHCSATVYCESARWWCHRCNCGGDAIDLVIAVKGLAWRDAVAWLADGLGIKLPSRHNAKKAPILSGSLGR